MVRQIRLKLPDELDARLSEWMAKNGISIMDKQIVIQRAIDCYLTDRESFTDVVLNSVLVARRGERTKKQKAAWAKGREKQ